MRKISQLELDALLDAHEQWWRARDAAYKNIRRNATDEQKSGTNTDWAEAELKKIQMHGNEIKKLENLDLSGLSLAGRNLTRVGLENVNLSEANLQETWFAQSRVRNVDFSQANLSDASFEEGRLEDVNFSGAMMRNTEIHSLKASKNLKFDNAVLENAVFVKSSIDFASFKKASLEGANFRRCEIKALPEGRSEYGRRGFFRCPRTT